MFNPVNQIVVGFFYRLLDFLPNLFGGIFILIGGFLLAKILKRFILALFSFFKLSLILQKTKLMQPAEVEIWERVIAEIVRWTVVIVFLIPTLEIWGLSRAIGVLNQVLLYLPNVIIAVIIVFIGLIAANLAADVVRHSVGTLGEKSAQSLAIVAKSSIIFFTTLIALNQLGVAQDLIRILFTGIVAMLALAGGLAFGLGGKDIAKDLLAELKKKMSS